VFSVPQGDYYPGWSTKSIAKHLNDLLLLSITRALLKLPVNILHCHFQPAVSFP
jgi:hypothetical protein